MITRSGIVASAHVVQGTDVLLEPFNNFTFAPWTTAGTPTIVTGRTGNAAQVSGVIPSLTYTIPSVNQNATVVVGCAYRITAFPNQQNVLTVRSDAAATQHGAVAVLTNGTLFATNAAGTSVVSSAAGAIVINTWYYIEVRYLLGDSPNGTVELRLNGVSLGNITGIDTKNAGTKTVYDSVRLGPSNASSGGTDQYDDLYITVGAGAPFKGSITIP